MPKAALLSTLDFTIRRLKGAEAPTTSEMPFLRLRSYLRRSWSTVAEAGTLPSEGKRSATLG
ncbi:MAG: hypothetical protein ACPGWR_19910, partial [Ardenticatenaceae bacterium]